MQEFGSKLELSFVATVPRVNTTLGFAEASGKALSRTQTKTGQGSLPPP